MTSGLSKASVEQQAVSRWDAPSADKPSSIGIAAVVTLGLAYAIVLFEQVGANYLFPGVKAELHLSNMQIGLLPGALCLAMATSSLLGGSLIDRLPDKRPALAVALLMFGAASVLAAFAADYGMLLGSRVIVGLCGGPILPLVQSMVAERVAPQRRGAIMGIVQSLGANIMASFLSPLVMVAVSAHHGWRAGFFLTLAPAAMTAALVLRAVRRPAAVSQARDGGQAAARVPLRSILSLKSIWLCAIILALISGYSLCIWTFVPAYLTSADALDTTSMAYIMSGLGISGAISGICLPALSDRFGRKPLLVAAGIAGLSAPCALIFGISAPYYLGAALMLGWFMTSVSTLVIAAIPSDVVPAGGVATAIGFVVAFGSVAGGFILPIVAGSMVDRFGFSAISHLLLLCAALVIVAAWMMPRPVLSSALSLRN